MMSLLTPGGWVSWQRADILSLVSRAKLFALAERTGSGASSDTRLLLVGTSGHVGSDVALGACGLLAGVCLVHRGTTVLGGDS